MKCHLFCVYSFFNSVGEINSGHRDLSKNNISWNLCHIVPQKVGVFSIIENDEQEAAKSEGDTKSSYNPKKWDGKTGRTGQWIYYDMVEEPEAR